MQHLILIFRLLLTVGLKPASDASVVVAAGRHPSLAVSPDGRVELVFGRDNAIHYAYSLDGGKTFAPAVVVDSVQYLHVGASRSPQIASGRNSAVIVAVVGKEGTVMGYQLNRKTEKWSKRILNDVPEVAKEGFVSVASDGDGLFYAVWLDLRGDQQNKIVGVRSEDGGATWSANAELYRSPDGTVCECCRPAVAIGPHQTVYVLFRNNLSGSRDLHLMRSTDAGKRFRQPEKLGRGTWKLNACPMDGGDLTAQSGRVETVWRREQTVFTARADGEETALSSGKLPAMTSTPTGMAYVWQQADGIHLRLPGEKEDRHLGAGGYARIIELPDHRNVVCAWEDQQQIRVAVIPIPK